MNGKELAAEFKAAPWVRPEDMTAFVNNAGPQQPGDLLKLLDLLTARNAAQESPYIPRCQAFARLAAAYPSKELFVPMVRALKTGDQVMRTAFLPALTPVNNISEHGEVIALLRSPDNAMRILGSQVLRQVGGKHAFDQLADALRDKDFLGRMEAMDVVAALGGHHAVPALAAVLTVGKPAERVHALQLLGETRVVNKDVPGAIRAISLALNDPTEMVVIQAITSLSAVATEEEWFNTSGWLLGSDNVNVVKAAVDSLRVYKTPRAINAMTLKLRSGPNAVRYQVLTSLETIGNDDVLPTLVEALGIKQIVIRNRAGEVLTRLGQAKKIDVARTIVWLLRSRDVNVRRMAVEIAASVKDPDNTLWPKLLVALKDQDWWVRERLMDALVAMAGKNLTRHMVALLADPSDVMRRYAIDAMARLKDPNALGALVRTMTQDEDWWVKEKAVDAIAALGDQRAVPYLLEMIARMPDFSVACLKALGDLGAVAVAPQVAGMVAHADPDIRLAAVQCLGALNDTSQAGALQAASQDPSPAVRTAAKALMARWNLSIHDSTTGLDRHLGPLDRMLMATVRAGGDDLILAPGRPPMMKRLGKTGMLSQDAFSAEQVRALLQPLLLPGQSVELDALRDVDISYEVKAEQQRFRVNVFNQMGGLGAVFRVIKGGLVDLASLGLPPVVQTFGDMRDGLVLLGGPNGSGKSTTLSALLDYINTSDSRHVVSLEDPIEVIHTQKKSLVNQRELGTHTRSFASALRGALRQDPDVILVGELRDLDTIRFALTASETGHLVFGTVHTVAADTTVDRLVNAFPSGQQDQARAVLASSLRAVLCQYLLQRKDGRGRVVATELMINNDAIANMIRKGKAFQIPQVIATSREQGMHAIDQDLARLVRENKVSLDEAYVKARNKKEFELMLQNAPSPLQRPGGPGTVRGPGTPPGTPG